MANLYWDPNEDPNVSYLRKRAYGLEDPNLQVANVAPQAPTFQQQLDQQQTIQPGEIGQGDSEFYKGLRQGTYGLIGGAYGGVGQLARLVGADQIGENLSEAQRDTMQVAEKYAAPRMQRIEDVQSVGDLADYAMGMLGQATPSGVLALGSIATGGAAGGLAAAATGGVLRSQVNRLAGKAALDASAKPAFEAAAKAYAMRSAAANKTGQWLAGGATSALPQIGDIGERIDNENPLLAIGAGLAAGALDVLPMMHGIQRVVKPEGVLKSIGKQALEEGVTEGAQEVIARGAENLQKDAPMFNDEALSAYLNNALAGVIAGGAFGGIGGVAGKMFGPQEQETPPPPPGAVEGQDQRGFTPPPPPDSAQIFDRFNVAREFVESYARGEHQDSELAGRALRMAERLATQLPDGPEADAARAWRNSFAGGQEGSGVEGTFWEGAGEGTTIPGARAPGDLAETSAFDERYAAQQQAAEDQMDQGQVYGAKFHLSPSGKPYMEGDGLTGSASALEKMQAADPDHVYEKVSYLTMVEREAADRGLTGAEKQKFITQRANELLAKMQNSEYAPDAKQFTKAADYLNAPQFSVIMQSPRSPGGADYESGFSLTTRELGKTDPVSKTMLVHRDVDAAELDAKKNRGIQFDTPQGPAFADSIRLTNTMMNKQVGRVANEEDITKRAGSYFLSAMSALMANPSLQATNFHIPDATIIYRENGKEVRYGQIKNAVNPVAAAQSAMESIKAEGVRLQTEVIPSIEKNQRMTPEARQATVAKLKGRVTALQEQYKLMKQHHASEKNAQDVIPIYDENGRQIAAEPRRPFPPGALNESEMAQGESPIEWGQPAPFRVGDEMLSTPSGQELPEAASDYAAKSYTDLSTPAGQTANQKTAPPAPAIKYAPTVPGEAGQWLVRDYYQQRLAEAEQKLAAAEAAPKNDATGEFAGADVTAARQDVNNLRSVLSRMEQRNSNEGLDQRGPDAPNGVTPEQQQVVSEWVDEAQKKYEQHKDLYAKLQRYASKMAKMLGLTDILIVSPEQYAQLYGIYGDTMGTFARYMNRMSPSSRTYGTYHGVIETPWAGKKNIIWISPRQMGSRNITRVLETLGHEIGHAVMHEYWQNASPQVKRMVTSAYEKWRRSLNVDGTVADVWKDKVGLNRFEDVTNGAYAQTDLSNLTPDQFEYLTNFDEWFADQVSKWFQTAVAPLSEVDRFFKGIADTLKKLYDRMVQHGWKTTKEVDDFLNDIVAKAEQQHAVDSVVHVVQQQRGWRAAIDYLHFLLTGQWKYKPQLPPMPGLAQELRTDITQNYRKGSKQDEEKKLVKAAIKALRLSNSLLARINAQDGIELMRQLQVLAGAQGIDLVVGRLYNTQYGQQTAGGGLMKAFQLLLDAKEQEVLHRAASTAAVRAQLERLLRHDEKALQAMRDDAATAAAYMYIFHKAGLLKVGPETFNTYGIFTQRVDKVYQTLIGKASENSKIAALLEGLQTEAVLQRNLGGTWEMPADVRDNVFQKSMQTIDALYQGFNRKLMDKVWTPAFARMKDSNNAYLQLIARKMVNTSYDFNPEKGWIHGVTETMTKLNNALVDEVFGDKYSDKAFVDKVREVMQNRDLRTNADPEVLAVADKLQKWFDSNFAYLKHVGLATDKDKRANYFPWFFDVASVEQRVADGSWAQFINQPKFDAAWAKLKDSMEKNEQGRRVYFLGKTRRGKDEFLKALATNAQLRAGYQALPKNKNGTVNAKALKQFIEQYVQSTLQPLTVDKVKEMVTDRLLGGELGVGSEEIRIHNPQMRFINARDIAFLADATTTAQDRAYMASLMQKNLYTILHTYVRQTAKRGEYARRFGPGGEKLEEWLEMARNTGATSDDIETAYNFIDVMLGTSGIQTKQFLDGLLEKAPLPAEWKAKLTKGVVINPKLQNAMGWMMVYQNYRLLAMATLSSVIDPLGIGVRSGSMGMALVGMRTAIRSTLESFQGNKDDLMQLAEMLGTIDRHMLRDSIIAQYANNYVGEKQTRANDLLFKYNGLEAWTKWTRLAATGSALAFLKRHIVAPTKHSARYLEELGIRPGDVKFDTNGNIKVMTTAERARATLDARVADGRVRDAITRFVDQSIVRPNASQRPMWMSDPHVMLFGHLKSYLFGFYETILKRAYSEAIEHGNVTPALMLLAFIPVMFAADALREYIQYGPRGAPWKRGWSAWDHIQYETVRAGLTGRGEIIHNLERGLDKGLVAGGISYLGPTTQQLYDFGASRPNWKQDIVNALPLNNVYKNWFNRAPEKTKTQEDVEKLGSRVKQIESKLAMI